MKSFANIWKPRSLVVIFAQFTGSEIALSAARVSSKKAEDAQRFDTLEELVKFYGSSSAYHLHVTGSGVLLRKTEDLDNYRDELIINGNSDDFLFTAYRDGFSIAVSFFRKDAINGLLEACTAQHIHLLNITAGLVPIFGLADDVQVQFSYQLTKEAQRIVDFSRAEIPKERAMYDGAYYSESTLVAMALFAQALDGYCGLEITSIEAFANETENYNQHLKFKVLGVGLTSIIFVIVVTNYFYMNALNQEIAQLEQDLTVSTDNLALLDRLNEETKRKQQLVVSTGVNSPRFLSFYLDEIGASVPSKITLQHMQVFPIEGKLKNKRKVEVINNQLRIEGSTPGNEIMDDWIERMNRFEWVGSIELINYLKDKEGSANFKLLITLTQ